ncbi:MAG: amino acid transporter [Gammaproteobacteria bacterium]|jgi:L-lysine exporter family protein LysE/ArgO|nr:amino acid transporter [Gammaproteobacteria bacterium]
MDITPLIKGYLVCISLIVAIGPQNAFVLRQGLRKQHVLLTALICSSTDAILIAAGVLGFGAIIASHPLLLSIAKWFGAAFLFLYGLKSFYSAWKNEYLDIQGAAPARSQKEIISALLVVGLLNPHAYLDTMVLIGTIGAQFAAGKRYLFTAGALLASITWFFFLGFGAGFLAAFFKKPLAWKILDIIIAFIMISIAVSLVYH